MGIQYHLSMHRHNLCAFRTSEKSKENREWDEIECELKWTGGLKWAGVMGASESLKHTYEEKTEPRVWSA